ncbi:MAG: type II toxin-antitoxin system PemK/MazF family toxin [Syntrophomonadaceae bacterium]|jgi:mRNA interferase MazF|nr:type II toxin-antitoxin system PemK/MazF family toxin [Syntrophomonadaceae bacterium]
MKCGELWWVDFDPTVGSEIQKTRPAVIVSNDLGNHYSKRVQVVPMSSNTSRIFPVETLVTVNGATSKAMADQLTTVDKQRLKNRIGSLSAEELALLEKAIRIAVNLRPAYPAHDRPNWV